MRPFPEAVAPEFSGVLDIASGLSLYSPWGESESSRHDEMGPDKSCCFLVNVYISYTLLPNSSYFPRSIVRIIETLVPDLIRLVSSKECCSTHLFINLLYFQEGGVRFGSSYPSGAFLFSFLP